LEFRDKSIRGTARRHPRVASAIPGLAVFAIAGLIAGDPVWLIFALLLEPFAIGWFVFARRDDHLLLDESGVTDARAELTQHWDWDEVAAIGAGSAGLRGVPLFACCFGRTQPRRIGGFRPSRDEAGSVIQSIADAGWPVFEGTPVWNWDLDQRSKTKRT
jgi:hypothetical protein